MAHKRHSSDFKREAVKLALTSGLPREGVASDLGIGKSTLGKWITQYRQDQKSASEPLGGTDDWQRELARLRRENKVLREERVCEADACGRS